MALPNQKGNKWIKLINTMIESKHPSTKDLEKLIGRLVRVSIITPGSLSYLRAIRSAFYSAI